MLELRDIIDMMEKWAPEDLAEEWDNVGFQIGNYDKEIGKILIALDIDHRVVDKAIREKFHMIITHHPFIFSGMKRINSLDYDGRIVMDLIKNDIVAYNAHTNLDQAVAGVNDELARLFKLEDSRTIVKSLENSKVGYGKIGNIKSTTLYDYINIIKSTLSVDNLTVFGAVGREINKVAVVGGSGAGFIKDAAEAGADLLITGDIKYHDGQAAEKLGLSIVDAGHFHTEKVILPLIKDRLERLDGDLELEIYDKPSPLYGIY